MEKKNWLLSVLDYEVEKHWREANDMVEQARRECPSDDPDIIANQLINSKARLAAFIGAGTGVLQSIPTVGQAIAVGVLLPEALYLAKMQIDIALVIALLYKKTLSKLEARGVVFTCLILALGADFIKNDLRLSAIKITSKVIEATLEKIGKKVVSEALGKGMLKRVPLISIPLNAVMNYEQLEAFGWAAKKFLSPSFVMCGSCGNQIGKMSKYCSRCGLSMGLSE